MGKSFAIFLRRWLVLLYDHFFLRKMAEVYGTIGQSSFFLIWAVITGIITGAAVVLIRIAAAALEALTGTAETGLAFKILIFFAPVAGMALSYLIKKTLSHSNSSADMTLLIQSIRQRKPELIRLETFSHIAASPLTAGLRASAGLTTPSILTGASMGASIGRLLHISADKTVQLMTCGTAAGIAAIFGSPISSVLFAVEVLLPKMNVSALIPVLLSAAGATVVMQVSLANTPFFEMLCKNWEIRALPYYIILGLLSSAIGIGMIRSNKLVGNFVNGRIRTDLGRLFLGGLAVASLVFLFPQLSGEGIGPIQNLIRTHSLNPEIPFWLKHVSGNAVFLLLFTGSALFLLKTAATSLTLSCGGSGGFFAPSLFVGAFFGFTLKHMFDLLHWGNIYDTNFIALGMCGVFASSFRAPLTGIFLVVEMSGSYVLMIPLIIVAAISYFITAFFENDSIYTNADESGSDEEVMENGTENLRKVISGDYISFSPDRPVNWEVVLNTTQETIFPVLDAKGCLLGVILRPAIEKTVMLNKDGVPPKKLMIFPKVTLSGKEKISMILAAMKIFSMTRLPILDSRLRFQGFVRIESKDSAIRSASAMPHGTQTESVSSTGESAG